MIEKTEGIVLHTIKYSESSIIAHIFTKNFGNHSFIMNNVRSNRSKMSFFQPLSIVSIQFYSKKNEKLHRIKEISFCEVHTNMYENIYKSTISLFIGEFLNKLCANSEPNSNFYDYVKQYVQFLENNTNSFSSSHISFIFHSTKYWGIFPENNYDSTNNIFDLQSGNFTNFTNQTTTNKRISSSIHSIISDFTFEGNFELSRIDKKELLQIILSYYAIHSHKIDLSHTLDILENIFE